MAKRDYYEVLGVAKGASQDEIKKAFRKKPTRYLATQKSAKPMTNLVMLQGLTKPAVGKTLTAKPVTHLAAEAVRLVMVYSLILVVLAVEVWVTYLMHSFVVKQTKYAM